MMRVSLVEVEPSTSMQSKVTPLAAPSASWAASALGSLASVVRKTSIVARDGAIMPTPLAIAPMLQPSPS